jgi:hypothetical protein
LTLSTDWEAATAERFVTWVQTRLAPKLRVGDVVVMDNLAAHKDPRVRNLIAHCGATLAFLPPYSYDLNPIESAWALIKSAFARSHRARRMPCGPSRNALGEPYVPSTVPSGTPMLVTADNSTDLCDLWD